MFTRIIDYLKLESITALFTSLSAGRHDVDHSGSAISSLMDTWIALSMVEESRARRRTLSVLKSRGMSHSNIVREFTFSERGLQILDSVPAAGG
jgi:circadian clock protein KaiC